MKNLTTESDLRKAKREKRRVRNPLSLLSHHSSLISLLLSPLCDPSETDCGFSYSI
ncbi:hypothetical protein KAT73_04400 [candidate division WOR-3 bacterium]|nr:hypothetical protein [candidate division WOR-3 bacterium]